jgi:cytochrome oxidase Cu insertion factor (SCO1/SenC/PrrC family)
VIYLVVAAIIVAAVVLFAVSRSRGSNDGVDSFRRQIDALSAEARRPVIDQVQNAAERDDPPAADGTDHDGQDGARGT